MIEILNVTQEIWKPIINYEGLYKISNYGRVKRLIGLRCKRERFLTPAKDKDGYLFVRLCKNGLAKNCLIHKLVLNTFVGSCPVKMESCHNDGDIENNFIENLRYDTHKGNCMDRIKHKTNKSGSGCNLAKLNEKQVSIIKWLLRDGYLTQIEIAKIFNVTQATISAIKINKSWKQI